MQVFAALADPTRRQILEMLASQPMHAGAIAERFEISAPAISQHLKVLRDARLVRVNAAANRRIYQLDPDGIDDVRAWLDGITQFWTLRLDALEAQLKLETTKAQRRNK